MGIEILMWFYKDAADPAEKMTQTGPKPVT